MGMLLEDNSSDDQELYFAECGLYSNLLIEQRTKRTYHDDKERYVLRYEGEGIRICIGNGLDVFHRSNAYCSSLLCSPWK